MPSALQAGLQPGAHDTRSPNTKMTPPPSVSSSTSSPTSKEKEKGKDSAVVLQLAKTKMCAFFERGKCSSDTCRYAHSPAELRRPPNLQKTKLCKAFLQGKCRDGENCSFAHGDSDLRVTAGIYKTQMCNFYERGHCKKGDRCNHAHGDADLRHVIPSPQKTPVREKGNLGALQTPDARTPPKVEQGERSPPSKKGAPSARRFAELTGSTGWPKCSRFGSSGLRSTACATFMDIVPALSQHLLRTDTTENVGSC